MAGYRRIRDYYRVLGVSPGASRDEIDRSFRAAAKETHPDLVMGRKGSKKEIQAAEERFKAISDAYSILSSEEKRRKYDKIHFEVYGVREDPRPVKEGPPKGTHTYMSASDLEDIYRELFDSDGRPRDRRDDGAARAPEEDGCRFDAVVNLGPGTRLRKDNSIGRIPTNVRPTYGRDNGIDGDGLERIGRVPEDPAGRGNETWEKVPARSFGGGGGGSPISRPPTGDDGGGGRGIIGGGPPASRSSAGEDRWEKVHSGSFDGSGTEQGRHDGGNDGPGPPGRHRTAPPEYSSEDGGRSWARRTGWPGRTRRVKFLKLVAPRLIGFLLIAAAAIFLLDHFNMPFMSNCCFCGSLLVLFLVVVLAISYRGDLWVSSSS